MWELRKSRGGGQFSKKSEIQKSLNYLRGGGGPIWESFYSIGFSQIFQNGGICNKFQYVKPFSQIMCIYSIRYD